jgi:hypothetical protein
MKYSEIIKNHKTFKMNWLGEWYAETQALWFQCVAWAKIYSKECLWVTLWVFWPTRKWTAYTWRLNKSNTFNLKVWNKVEYNGTRKPPVWAIVFFKPDASNGQAGHVGICDLRIKKGISILEQNGWGKGNYAPWDEFTLRNRSLKNCLGWYSLVLDNNLW